MHESLMQTRINPFSDGIGFFTTIFYRIQVERDKSFGQQTIKAAPRCAGPANEIS
jgi:hypothetical protein